MTVQAYSEGRLAYFDGESYIDNPYGNTSHNAIAWEDGYYDAKEEASDDFYDSGWYDEDCNDAEYG